MIIGDFHIVSIAILKAEANAPLVDDAGAPLTLAIMCQCFESV